MLFRSFVTRAREAKRDYDAFLLKQRQEEHAEGYFPRVRNVKDIMAEAETSEFAEQVLTSCNANSPEMGWKACLAWIMRLDPISVEKRKAGEKERKHEFLTHHAYRMKQRELIKNLTFDTINTSGDSHE